MAEPSFKSKRPAKNASLRVRAARSLSEGTAHKAGGNAAGLRPGSPAAIAVEDAQQAGLLEHASTHVSFRAPKALLEAAMREAGVTSPTQLGVAALALLAQPDPVAAYFKESFGALGPDFDLDY